MTIFIEESNTDKLREGETVFISRLGHHKCPVKLVEKYVKMAKLDDNPNNFLICRLATTKVGHVALGNFTLSDTRVRENFKEMMRHIDINAKEAKLCLHSLRSGRASAAAGNGVSDRMISKHGRWASNTSRDTYIKDTRKARLSVTKKLGL